MPLAHSLHVTVSPKPLSCSHEYIHLSTDRLHVVHATQLLGLAIWCTCHLIPSLIQSRGAFIPNCESFLVAQPTQEAPPGRKPSPAAPKSEIQPCLKTHARTHPCNVQKQGLRLWVTRHNISQRDRTVSKDTRVRADGLVKTMAME